MTIVAYPPNPTATGTSLIVFSGLPRKAVVWSLIGSGTLTPLSSITDDSGACAAIYTPGDVGSVNIVNAQHGT